MTSRTQLLERLPELIQKLARQDVEIEFVFGKPEEKICGRRLAELYRQRLGLNLSPEEALDFTDLLVDSILKSTLLNMREEGIVVIAPADIIKCHTVERREKEDYARLTTVEFVHCLDDVYVVLQLTAEYTIVTRGRLGEVYLEAESGYIYFTKSREAAERKYRELLREI